MSTTIYLDPNETARLEPHEGDSNNGSWISPFDVPEWIDVGSIPAAGICILRFHYPGGETGDASEPIDRDLNPSIVALTARYSGKILELHFNPPIQPADFPGVSARLDRQWPRFGSKKSKQFSYMMIARILDHWNKVARDRPPGRLEDFNGLGGLI